jgi:hypothetical protein
MLEKGVHVRWLRIIARVTAKAHVDGCGRTQVLVSKGQILLQARDDLFALGMQTADGTRPVTPNDISEDMLRVCLEREISWHATDKPYLSLMMFDSAG